MAPPNINILFILTRLYLIALFAFSWTLNLVFGIVNRTVPTIKNTRNIGMIFILRINSLETLFKSVIATILIVKKRARVVDQMIDLIKIINCDFVAAEYLSLYNDVINQTDMWTINNAK